MRRKRSTTQVDDDFRDFLRDMYPGIEQAPTQMVQMMASPQIKPDDKVESSALFHQENIEACEATEPKCPDLFHRPHNATTCIYRSRQEVDIDDAATFCNSIGNTPSSQILRLEILQDTQFLSQYFLKGLKGMCCEKYLLQPKLILLSLWLFIW